MKVNDIRELLATLDGEMEAEILLGDDHDCVESFSIVEKLDDSYNVVKTILVIGNGNDHGMKKIGCRKLSEAEITKKELKVLDGLADIHRKKSSYERFKKFTNDYGDFRIYTDSGDPQDAIGGSASVFDPRIFIGLRDRGLIRMEPQPYRGVPMCSITPEGVEYLKQKKGSNAT